MTVMTYFHLENIRHMWVVDEFRVEPAAFVRVGGGDGSLSRPPRT